MRHDPRTTLRRWLKAQSTILNWLGAKSKPYGYYIPYSYVSDLKSRDENYVFSWLMKKWDSDPQVFLHWLGKIKSYNPIFSSWSAKETPERSQSSPRFDQDWFPGLDGAMAYTLVREVKPAKVIEVGSGHSTRFLAQAIKDGELNTHLHSIDPVPRKDIDSICDQITRNTVDKVDPQVFLDLKSKDVLFIDASHIHMPGTDVDFLFHEILPCLQKGVFIHIHDIFLPFEYPNEWQWRNYTEQHALLGLLGGGSKFKVLTAHHYFRRHHPEWLKDLNFAVLPGAKEASVWLEVVE